MIDPASKGRRNDHAAVRTAITALGTNSADRQNPGLYCAKLTARRKTRSLGLLKKSGYKTQDYS
jgi:hypothetical protein